MDNEERKEEEGDAWTFHLRGSGMTLFPLVATGMRSFLYSSGRNFSISTLTGVLSVTKPCLGRGKKKTTTNRSHDPAGEFTETGSKVSLRFLHLTYLLMRSSTSSTSMVFLLAWAEYASRSSASRSKYLCSLRHGTESVHRLNNARFIINMRVASAYMSLMTG